MQDDPVRYWQDLTGNYARMSDGELLELDARPEDLTEVAQQALRDEMNKRGLAKAKPEPMPQGVRLMGADIRWEPASYRYEFAKDDLEQGEGEREYTWKTRLCDCETRMQAIQLARALQEAGIDSWIQTSRATADVMDLTYPRILVAADQLEQAQAVAGQPVPQHIIDESMEELEAAPQEFEAPSCPQCGATDPVLCAPDDPIPGDPKPDDEDWVNTWHCEACGAEWSDAEQAGDTRDE